MDGRDYYGVKFGRDITEIIFFARSGQGAKTTAEIIAQAALREGKFVQAFPVFGPERSGAPIKTFVRIASEPIRTREPIVDPDIVVVLDETVLDSQQVDKNLSVDESLIINTRRSPAEIKEAIGFNGKIHTVDANGISMEIVGQPRPNTVILGKLVKVSSVAKLESVMEEFRKIFGDKLGPEMTQKNLLAIEKSYDSL